MIYPGNFEQKIGFSEIRKLLKGRCMSTLGTDWVDHKLEFSADAEIVERRLAEANEFCRLIDEEDDIFEDNFFDARQALLRIRPERTYMEELELFDLKRSLKTVADITSFLTGNEEEDTPRYPALRRMCEGVCAFPDIIQAIDNILNKFGKIKDTASPELLSLRHQMEVTQRSITHSLRAIVTEAQQEGYIDRDVSPTLRDGRLVIPVAPALKRKIKGIIHDESATGKTVFIEPAAVVDANNRIRELKAQERREIMRILQELTARIRPHAAEMLDSLRFLAHIDFLRAVRSFSSAFGCIVPQTERTPGLRLERAVHPLLAQSLTRRGKNIVPLDMRLTPEKRMLVVSGPNAGGKSVVLKTVGLLQYMLQCGLPVSVGEGTCMGIFSDIMLDIGDEQSIENALSTYSSHLLAMKQMMKTSTSRSLVLVDEFGGGTEPQIGGALAEGILDRLVAGGTFGIITTHYQNLKHYADNTPSVINGAMLYDRAQMQPLFMLQIGNPGSSFAVEIARKIGIPDEVIDYATELVGRDYVASDKYLQDIVRDKMYWERKRQNIRQREKLLEKTVARYEEEVNELHAQRKSVMEKARQEAQELLQQSNAKIENTIRAIREAQAEKERTKEIRNELADFRETLTANKEKEDAIARKMAKIQRRQERQKNRRNGATDEKNARLADHPTTNTAQTQTSGGKDVFIGPNSYVRIKGQSVAGRVESVDGRTARVLFGTMIASVSLDRLEAATKPKPESSVQTAATFVSRQTRDQMYEKKLRFKPDIDIRGMRGDEAMTTVALFIDEATMCEQSRVRILHGTGTGALRTLVRQYLGTVPGVRSFRDEHVQFGGAGITVVELD